MALESGTTWAFSVDGNAFGIRDLGTAAASSSGRMSTLCEESSGVVSPYVPPSVAVPVAMSLLGSGDGGTWFGVSEADLYNTANLSGAVGNLQDSSLPNGAMRIGGSVPEAAPGTPLWIGATASFPPDAGPAGAHALVPPLLTLTSPSPSAAVSKTVILSGTIESPSGTPALSSVLLVVDDDQTSASVASWTPTGPVYSASWDSTQVSDGVYYALLQANYADGSSTFTDVTFTVANGGKTKGSDGDQAPDGGIPAGGGGCGTTAGGSQSAEVMLSMLSLIGFRRPARAGTTGAP